MILPKTLSHKVSPDQNKKLKQAKALKQSGLNEEAILVYNNQLEEYPTLHEAFSNLKSLLKSKKD